MVMTSYFLKKTASANGEAEERPAKEIIGGIMEELVFFTEDAPQSDDITMMMITFRGSGAQS